MNPPNAEFWKRKLAAFLHDSPSKALDIYKHEERALKAFVRAGLISNEEDIFSYDKLADHTAAAADRIPFPAGQQISCCYDGVLNRFRHPLDGKHQLPPEIRPLNVADAEATESVLQPQLDLPDQWTDAQKWRAHFFAHWRLWRRNCRENNPALDFLPADTRLPDHTIWHHMGVVAAMAGMDAQPAFLKFQLGPVQEFISAARSTRDLWSSSYLISWLMATGMAALAREVGPNAIIFPSLFGQPIFDLQFREELWVPAKISHQDQAKNVWDSLSYQTSDLLTPNLPNIFLALVPATRAEELARIVERAIRYEWATIAVNVWNFSQEIVKPPRAPANARERFDSQVSRHIDLSWQTTPWPSSPLQALTLAQSLLPREQRQDAQSACDRLREFIGFFTATMPAAHRDARYYTDSAKTTLNNIGAAWSVLVALNAWQLDAARQTRTFRAWNIGGWETNATHNGKDALTGREEMIFSGNDLPEKWRKLFRHTDEVGALTLIKRTWHLAYLQNVWKLNASPEKGFRMPDIVQIAAGKDDESNDASGVRSLEKANYFAVLALDGDSIGQIVSGKSTPPLGSQLADYERDRNRAGAKTYFEHNNGARLLNLPRPLSPGFHLQFSEALSNFALHCVRPIVEAHSGKLLYAGGDDVLAILPAIEAIACADALQRAFRGDSQQNKDYKLEQIAPGFLARTDRRSNHGKPVAFIVPGPACTASVGIAMAKDSEPLQDVVRAAQAAEKRAKKLDGKHALAITVLKGSGEITEWVGHFGFGSDDERGGSSGLSAFWWMLHAINEEEILSRKFPHRLIELLEPYCSPESRPGLANSGIEDLNNDQFDLIGIVERELATALERQQGRRWRVDTTHSIAVVERLREAIVGYLKTTQGNTTRRLKDLIGLLTVTAFLRRHNTLD